MPKAPSPAGPTPIPYPVLTSPSGPSQSNWDTSKAVNRVKLQTKHGVSATQAGRFTASSGDNAGTLKGITGHKMPGKPSPLQYSQSVKVEGANTIRHLDLNLNRF